MAVQIKSTPAAVSEVSTGSWSSAGQHARWVIPAEASIALIRRLVVLIPSEQIDESALIQQVLKIAQPHKTQVVFVALNSNRVKDEAVRRRLGLMAARVRGSIVSYTQVLPDTLWLDAIRKVIGTGDAVVMPAGMSSELEIGLAKLNLPACLLPDLYPSLATRLLRGLGRLLFEVTPLLIIAAFLWLQIQVSAQTAGAANTMLTALTMVIELGLLVLWSLFLS